MPGLWPVGRSEICTGLPLWAAHQPMQQQGAHTAMHHRKRAATRSLQETFSSCRQPHAGLLRHDASSKTAVMMPAAKLSSPAGNAKGRHTCRHICVLPRPAAPTNCASNGWHVAQLVSRQQTQLGHALAALAQQQRGGSSAALASAVASTGFASNQAANQAARTSVTLPAGRPPSRTASSGAKLVRRCSGLAAASRSRSAT